MATPQQIFDAIGTIKDQQSFVQRLLMDTLGWPIPDGLDDIGDISYEWSSDELRADGLDKHLTDGRIFQIQKLTDDQPWGIFLLEFKNEDVFLKNRGLTGPLRKVLRGLVHNRRKNAALPSWDRGDLLFICTDNHYRHYRFAYFAAPKEKEKTAPLSLFGWNHGDTALHTLCEFNLSSLVWSDDIKQPQWKDAFCIEKVTKAFFRQVAKLFTDLVGGTRKDGSKTYQGENLLKLPGKQDDTVRKEFAVRLIGRLIFCWFLKKKVSKAGIPLVPDEILSTAAIDGKGVGGYYHSTLEPLFFELLNTPADSRRKDYKKQPWSYIPFLNGGLFTPHEFDFYEPADTGYSKHLNTLIVPDKWFIDLLTVFERYNFTIDENTPVDVELSIEPEMLGRIFENLLAEINPETGETARKSTGSYYTPRPIVEYMVDESLKQYLLTKLSPCQGGVPEGGGGKKTTPACGHPSLKGGELEIKISDLLSYGKGVPDFTEEQIEQIVDALHTVKIIDPACGSGAFPMGILQKILLMLQKLDPDSKRWLDKLLSGIPDPMYRRELKKKIKVPNYLHKLGIIRDCIFGVDIQPIAVEISKLRCFLSLIVDEAVDDTADNRGVEHLPNLEFKFVCANTLIGLPERHQKGQKTMFEADDKIDRLKELRDRYLISYGKEKKQIEQEFRTVQSEMFQHSLDWGGKDSQTTKLSQWNPFSDEPSSWFDPEWMFGIKEGFDIVIANPPYVRVDDIERSHREKYKQMFTSATGKYDMYYLFFEKSFLICSKKGTCVFISPNKFCAADSGDNLRRMLLDFVSSVEILSTSMLNVFEDAANYPVITVLKRVFSERKFMVRQAESLDNLYGLSKDFSYTSSLTKIKSLPNTIIPINISQKTFELIRELYNSNRLLSELISISEGLRIPKDLESPIKQSFEIVKQYQFERYSTVREGSYISKDNLSKVITEKSDRFKKMQRDKILIAEDALKITATIDELKRIPQGGVYFAVCRNDHINLKGILGILNSKLFSYIYASLYSGMHMGGGYLRYRSKFLENLPIPNVTDSCIVKHCQAISKEVSDVMVFSAEVAKLGKIQQSEHQIDQMVYELYGLTDDEIAIVEGQVK